MKSNLVWDLIEPGSNSGLNFNERLELTQVRFCRDRFSPHGDLGHRGFWGAVGLGYRFTV
jgi:hypothetical protein